MTQPDSQIQNTFYEHVEDPNKRYHEFLEHYCSIQVNQSTSVRSYIRSGKEILRMANIYFGEHDYLYAFVLYSRYVFLFLEKIRTHKEYSTCDKSEFATVNKDLKNVALPRAEKLQKYIKELFDAEAKEYKKKLEEEAKNKPREQITPSAPPPLPDPLSGAQLEALKLKYNLENENELRLLQQKELNSLNSISNNAATTQNLISDNQVRPSSSNVPTVDRSSKPKSLANSHNLRTIIVPIDLARKFLDLAESNTLRNVETCGILAGRLNQNTFTLSHCIIPKQSGSSDTCVTEHEHELFDTIDQLNLITLGWIHTHPTQTAFLSSIDLHTQYGYQIMIPEAVAIVCSPSHNEIKTFILTPSYGIKEIADCNKSGFHPHTNNPPLFEECDHVREDSSLKAQMIDLRIVTNRLY